MPGLRLFVNLMAEVSALPFEKHGPPGESGSESRQYNPVAAFQPAVPVHFIQQYRDGCCGSVAVLIQVNRYFLHWNV